MMLAFILNKYGLVGTDCFSQLNLVIKLVSSYCQVARSSFCRDVHCSKSKGQMRGFEKLLSFYTQPLGTCPSLISQPRLLSNYYPVITKFEQKLTLLLLFAKTDCALQKERIKVIIMMLALSLINMATVGTDYFNQLNLAIKLVPSYC